MWSRRSILITALALACGGTASEKTDAPVWSLAPEPTLLIGASEGPAETQLYQVRSAAKMSDGSVVVANGGTQELRVFSSDGDFIRSLGRRGPGPGEFQSLHYLTVLPGDTLMVGNSYSWSFFTAQGEHVGTGRRDWTQLNSTRHSIDMARPLSRAAFVLNGFVRSGSANDVRQRIRPAKVFLVARVAAEEVDTLGEFPGLEQFSYGTAGETAVYLFPADTEVAWSGDLVAIGDGATDSLMWFNAQTRARGWLRVPHPRQPISDQVRQQAALEACDWASGDQKVECEAGLSLLPPQSETPFFDELAVDSEGHIWIAQPAAGAAERKWSVVNAREGVVGSIKLPAKLRILDIGSDYVLGVVRDEYGVESIAEYRLQRDGT